MAFEVVMPRLGWTMETGSVVEWRKKDSEAVEVGDILFSVESDKAIQEVEVLESGILRIPPDSPPPGQQVPVGTLLAYVVQPGEPLPSAGAAKGAGRASYQPAAEGTVHVPAPADSPEPREQATHRGPTISPRARRVARDLGVDLRALKGSGRAGRIVEADIRRAAAEAARTATARATPLARRVATDLEVDIDKLAAERPGQRVTRADVETAAAAMARESRPESVGTPVGRMRRIIAERMAASAHTTAAVTLTTEADATELVRLRDQLKCDRMASQEPVPSYNDLLAKIVACALLEHPALNARLEGDVIHTSSAVHIGVAVDTERGLLVPVLEDVQAKGVQQIARESARLIEGARRGMLAIDDLRGGTFTITNLGMYEIDAFTPIINLPETAILGVGRIVPKQVVIDPAAERVAIRHMVFLSLTFDHRVVDGAPAARFLQRVKHLVEQPYLLLIQ